MMLAITATFLVAGMVKGIIGLGLPTITLAVFAVIFDLPTAMVLLIVPSFVTNLWQALAGPSLLIIIRRLWLFLLCATLTIGMAASAAASMDVKWLTSLLGVLLIVYASSNLAGLRLSFSQAQERWYGPLLGILNGIATGMTGSFVVPGVLFLQALGLDRHVLVQAMGILFTLSTAALAIALHQREFVVSSLSLLSAAGVIPAVVGMVIGTTIRKRITEQQFRRTFFFALLVLGAYLLATSFTS